MTNAIDSQFSPVSDIGGAGVAMRPVIPLSTRPDTLEQRSQPFAIPSRNSSAIEAPQREVARLPQHHQCVIIRHAAGRFIPPIRSWSRLTAPFDIDPQIAARLFPSQTLWRLVSRHVTSFPPRRVCSTATC